MLLKNRKILHITPHLGGGVGAVILNWMLKDESDNKHTIISLDKNNNKDWETVNDSRANVSIYDACYFKSDFDLFLNACITNNDIVLIHWWNHPLLYDVMVNKRFKKCRMIIWNHVSSLFPPYTMSEKLVDFTDYLIFTSPVSYESDEIKKLSSDKRKKLDVIWSTVGVESFDGLERIQHKHFVVGYAGTVDFGKLNSNFIKLCAAVKIPDVKFVVCSGDSQQHIIDEAQKMGMPIDFLLRAESPVLCRILPPMMFLDILCSLSILQLVSNL